MAEVRTSRFVDNPDGSRTRVGGEEQVGLAEMKANRAAHAEEFAIRSTDEVAVDAGYEGMTNEQLSDELEKRGLAKSGTKKELIARLEEDDAA